MKASFFVNKLGRYRTYCWLFLLCSYWSAVWEMWVIVEWWWGRPAPLPVSHHTLFPCNFRLCLEIQYWVGL